MSSAAVYGRPLRSVEDVKKGARAMGGLDEKTLETKMKSLSSTTRNVRAAKKICRNRDTIHTLLDALNTKPKFTKMVEYSLECLKNLAVDEVSVEEMIDEGVLESIINVMKLNPYNEKIQQMVNKTLQAFALNDRLAGMIAEKLGSAGLVFSMKKHIEAETLTSTCNATAKLISSSDAAVDMFVQGGVISGLKHVVHSQEENVEVLTAASVCLDRISGLAVHAGEIMESGVVGEMLSAINHFPECSSLVQHVLSLVGNLAQASPQYLEAIKSMGAVDILVAALELHPDNAQLNALAAKAFRLLASESDLASAFKVQQGNNVETANALSKLSSLLLVDENVDYLISNQGISWLVSALQQALPEHSEVASRILASGCRALMRVATDENKIYSIMQQGGVKLLVSIIEQHAQDENVTVSAIQALSKMVTRKENAVYIVKSGGVRGAIAALAAHPTSERVARAALELFANLARHESSVPQLVEQGVIGAVAGEKGILAHHASNPSLCQLGVLTMGRMALTEQSLAAMTNEGLLGKLVDMLKTHKDDAELATKATLMLETAALLPSNIEVLRSLGAMDAILGAMEAHGDNADIQNIGSRTLAMIAGEQQMKQAVDYVSSLSDQITKNPVGSNIAATIEKLFGATKLVGNLAMIDSNLLALQKSGAVRAMVNVFNAATKLTVSEKRNALLAESAQGLFRLAKDADSAASIVMTGVFNSLLEGSLKEVENEELATYVSQLGALCASHSTNVSKMVSDGNIEGLISLAQSHQLNETVLHAVVEGLAALATDEVMARRIGANGGAEVLVESIVANMLDKEKLTSALGLLNKLAVDDASIQRLVEAGAVDAVLNVMRAHPSDASLLTSCMQSLARLVASESIALEVGEKGGLTLCVKAMRDHHSYEPLVEVASILLESLGSTQENINRLMQDSELGASELAKWIGQSYANNSTIQGCVARIVENLEGESATASSASSSGATASGADASSSSQDVDADEDASKPLDNAQADSMISKLSSSGSASSSVEKGATLKMLKGLLAKLNADPKNAQLMLKKGGLKTLADLMEKYREDEDLFYAAASPFVALTEAGGDKILDLLEASAPLRALCRSITAHEVYATPMALPDLTKAVAATARLKMKAPLVAEMLSHKPLDALMRMVTQSDDPLLLTQAARLLSKMSNNPDAASILSKLASLRELIAAMRRNIRNEDFLKYSVYLLGNLALNEELKSQIGIEGGIQLILQIMDTYPMNEGLLENCCFALAELSFGNEVNVSFIVACKGVQLLLAAMVNHSKASDLLDSAVSVLCNLCHNSTNNKDLILKLDGAQQIVDAILNNFNSIDFLQTAFRTLGNLAYDPHSVTSIIKAGGVQGLVAGMTVHNDDMDLIDTAIRVLSNLAQDATSENMAIMAQEGAVQAIVEAATNYTDQLDIETAALTCLCNLSRQLSNAAMVIKQGGTETTIQAMMALDYDATLMTAAFSLINILAHSQPAELEKMHEAGVTPALVSGLKKHSSNRLVLANAMSAFTLLSYNSDAADRMGSQGVLQVILKLVQDHLADGSILLECFPALSSLSRSESNAVGMSELAMNALSQCISPSHSSANDARFLATCFSFLANLCVHSQATEGVLRTSLVQATLDTLHRFQGQPDVLIRGLKCLENMCFSTDEVKAHLRSQGVEEGVNKVSSDNLSLDDVRRAARAVLDALNRTDFNLELGALRSIKMKEIEIKSAKMLFGDEKKKVEEVKELPEPIRNLLIAGAMLTKHSNTAVPRSRHVYVTPDLKFIVWKDPRKPLHPDNKMKVTRIRTMERGRCTPQLQRTSFGKHLAKEECAFAIIGRERTIDLEASNEPEREKWINALEMLVAYTREIKKQAQQFHLG